MMDTAQVTTLPGGLRIATDAMPQVESVSCGIWIDAGARHEPAEVNGVSHLLEHMMFKGTARRSAQDIADEIEAVGGHINAWTSREATAFFCKTLKGDLPLAVDILGDIVQHSLFDEAELARERDVVLQEIGQAMDTPDDIIFDHFQRTAYPDQALGRPVLGDPGIVGSFPRDRLDGYHKANYTAPRAVVAAAGNLDHDSFAEMVGDRFAAFASGACAAPEAAQYAGGDYREARDLEQLHLLLGFRGAAHADDDYFAAMMHSAILGGGMSSRLFQEVREKRGLVYSVNSHNTAYADTGLYGIYAGTGPDRAAELAPVVLDQLADLARGAGPEELARARAQARAGLLMSRESTGARCEQLAHHMLVYGRPLPPAEILQKIDSIDEAAVGAFGEKLLAGPLTCAALGPAGGLESYDAMAARLAA
ncbi:MAG: insulinase family protein [Rhodospirillaceae bacterium]|nr:insulinase family protein [Rhodospirillaceae bacterium]